MWIPFMRASGVEFVRTRERRDRWQRSPDMMRAVSVWEDQKVLVTDKMTVA